MRSVSTPLPKVTQLDSFPASSTCSCAAFNRRSSAKRMRSNRRWPCRLCGLHIKHPALVDLEPLRLKCAMPPSLPDTAAPIQTTLPGKKIAQKSDPDTDCNQSAAHCNRSARQCNRSANLYNKSAALYNAYKNIPIQTQPPRRHSKPIEPENHALKNVRPDPRHRFCQPSLSQRQSRKHSVTTTYAKK